MNQKSNDLDQAAKNIKKVCEETANSMRTIGEALKLPLKEVIRKITNDIDSERIKREEYEIFSQEYRDSLEKEIDLLNEQHMLLKDLKSAIEGESNQQFKNRV